MEYTVLSVWLLGYTESTGTGTCTAEYYGKAGVGCHGKVAGCLGKVAGCLGKVTGCHGKAESSP